MFRNISPLARIFTTLSVTAAAIVMLLIQPVLAGAPVSPVMTADAQPTWQTNGIVWAMEHANGVIYVGGNFSSVRPPGAPKGTGEVARKNMAAFDAKTGALLPFNHTFQSPTFSYDPATQQPDKNCTVNWDAHTYTCDVVYKIRKSADGNTVFVGGDFNTVDGQTRSRITAFNTVNVKTANAPLTGFRVTNTNARVISLAVTNSAVYAGGRFTSTNGVTRNRLAAYNPATGALLPWAPVADKEVSAMVMAPNLSQVIVGGSFNALNGSAVHGLAGLNAANGAITWKSTAIHANSHIMDLIADGDTVYGAGEGNGYHVFDGRIAVNPYTGVPRWIDNCYGATQALALIGDVLYSGSHAHDCSPTDGGFPQSDTRPYRLLAESTHSGAPTLQHWFPSTNGGDPALATDRTPDKLGPRAMTADNEYVWVGGQFTTVNDAPQQSITRFTRTARTKAPATPEKPIVNSVLAGKANVTLHATEDLDDPTLSYRFYRNGAHVYTTTKSSKPWNKPVVSFTDSGLTPGTVVSYRVQAVDPHGTVSNLSLTTNVTVSGDASGRYPNAVLASGPDIYWRLADTASVMSNPVGSAGVYAAAVQHSKPSGVPSQPNNKSSYFTGFANSPAWDTKKQYAPATFSLEFSVNTTSSAGGKIIGFGNAQASVSTQYDRHVYMNTAGQLVFGIYTNRGAEIIKSPGAYRDGRWHHVIATSGADGLKLYVNGSLVASKAVVGKAAVYPGWWRIGGDNLTSWPEPRRSNSLAAYIDDVSIYDRSISAAEVSQHSTARR